MIFNESTFDIRDSLPGIAWPALPSQMTASLLSLYVQLEQSQWFSRQELESRQLRQLNALSQHVWRTNRYYRERLQQVGYHPGQPWDDIEAWKKIPVLTRAGLQELGADLRCSALPKGHGEGQAVRTSGSMGLPVTVYKNNIDRLLWHAFTLREHLWHKRDARAKIAIIRKVDNREALPPHGKLLDNWGAPFHHLYATGPAALLDLGSSPVRVQTEWLQKVAPDYLLTYPTNAAALARYFTEHDLQLPALKEVITLSESLSNETRDACKTTWGAAVKDIYSAQEVGYIALQCPEDDHYHVLSESLLVEVLDEDGEWCTPGEIGRVVVTSLHNFVTPLLRYEIGDYAEVGAPCHCGRGLPVLKKVLGRMRNMLTYPSGDQVWPVVRPSLYSQVAPVRQVQMVQQTTEKIEVRLVVSAPLTAVQEVALTRAIQDSLGHPFQLEYRFLEQIPRTPGGKFEEFVSQLN